MSRLFLPRGNCLIKNVTQELIIEGDVPDFRGEPLVTDARNVSMGKPSDRVLQVAESIISGLTKGIEALRPGVTAGEIHRIVRGEVAKAGYGEDFRRRAGYSIGIDWYNGDTLSIREGEPTVLKPGMTFHLNPDCLVPGIGTVMASETVLVTEDGHEVLGKTERRLFVK